MEELSLQLQHQNVMMSPSKEGLNHQFTGGVMTPSSNGRHFAIGESSNKKQFISMVDGNETPYGQTSHPNIVPYKGNSPQHNEHD